MDGEPLLDLSILDRLRDWGGVDLKHQMIELFFQNAPERVEGVREGLANGDLELAERSAHSLQVVSGEPRGAGREDPLGPDRGAARGWQGRRGEGSSARIAGEVWGNDRGPRSRTRTGRRMKPTIAVVEDNPDNRLLVQAILDDQYEIVEYESGASALEGFEELIPDLVLLDISLPEMDGTEVLRKMKEDPRLASVPVVALTAHAMSGDRERFLGEGFDEYVSKPILDDTLLLEAIERGLASET